jgi:hypothetical protein
MHYRRERQNPRTDLSEPQTGPTAEQIIDQDHVPGLGRHLLHQVHGLLFCEVMQKQRAHHNVKTRGQRFVQNVGDKKINFHVGKLSVSSRMLDGNWAHIATCEFQLHIRTKRMPCEPAKNIATTRSNVEDTEPPASFTLQLTERIPQNIRTATPEIDASQTTQRLAVTVNFQVRPVHQFRLQTTLRHAWTER